MRTALFSFYHIIFGLVVISVLIFDLGRTNFQIFNYFSFFTNQCIFIFACVFLYLGFANKGILQKPNVDSVRGALVAYMLIVAGLYAVLLSKIDDPSRVLWIDFIYHKLLPGTALISWIIFPPAKSLKYSNISVWLAYPLLFVIFTLIRGAVTNWYPYYFFDPSTGGYLKIFTFSAEVIVIGLFISWLLIFVGNLLGKLNLFSN